MLINVVGLKDSCIIKIHEIHTVSLYILGAISTLFVLQVTSGFVYSVVYTLHCIHEDSLFGSGHFGWQQLTFFRWPSFVGWMQEKEVNSFSKMNVCWPSEVLT